MAKEKKFNIGVKGIVRDGKRGIVLLREDWKSGDFWDTPGGRIDGDEQFGETLFRELNEELPGIKGIKIGKLLGVHRVNKDITDDLGLVLVYFYVEAKLPEEVQLSSEHQGYLWVKSTSDLPKGLNSEAKRIIKEIL